MTRGSRRPGIWGIWVVSAAAAVLLVSAADARLFSLVSEQLTERSSQEFSAGICNASLPLNDHLYQLVGWCRQLNLGLGCFSRGAVACLFKKYIDTFRGMPAAGLDSSAALNSEEPGMRLSVFWDNLMAVAHQVEARLAGKGADAATGAARFGITKFMHLSPAEFRARYLTSLTTNGTVRGVAPISGGSALLRRRRRAGDGASAAFAARPDRIDWREAGAVTSVKNQGSCGACWAFAVTEVAETEFARQGRGPLTALSVQQVTDCTRCQVCAGCRGGDICQTAGFYSSAANHIVEDRLYPYVGTDGTCLQVTGGYQVQTANVRCESFVNREDALVDHLWQSGTAAVAVDAHMWQYYIDGTIMHNCATDLNHAVQLVGYDLVSGPVPFYLARNSWGPDWGMGGYLQIAQGSNLCGLAQNVVTFTVA